MIVKNESLIISRCLDSLKEYVDYIVISDTGSSDNTIEVINNYLINNKIPGKVFQDEWKNFGYNRTKSLINAQQYCKDIEDINDKSKNFFITVDADMILEFNNFKKEKLNESDLWTICQYNSSICYYNSRIFRSNLPFKCIGVTHEYWDCILPVSKKNIDTIIINDIGDGGSKSQKFTRDIQLLTKGIEDDPNNYRYYFYLAQSYEDINDYDNAIKWYKKRIEVGNWIEEIFISYKRIGEIYIKKNEEEKVVYYLTLAYETLPTRSESLYKISNYYRNKGKNFTSLLYIKTGLKIKYPKDLFLFLEYQVYDYKFLEELSIIGYYVNKKKEGMLSCQYLLLNKKIPECVRNCSFNNNFFYINPISQVKNYKLLLNTRYPFISSSASLLKSYDLYKGIIRAVNYSINDSFKYDIRDIQDKVMTINYWIEFDKEYNIQSFYEVESYCKKNRESRISGFEDIRLCMIDEKDEKIYGLSVSFEYGKTDQPSIVFLHFEKENGKYIITKVFPITYNDNICQKNWTLFSDGSKLYSIYSHHPLTILEINIDNGDYKIVKEKYSDYNLKDIRGSANPLKIDNCWLILVHEVVQKSTRKYYHRFLKYSDDWELLDISEPFYFKELFVEFSLSVIINNMKNSTIDTTIDIIYSSRDNTTEIMTIKYSDIYWLPRDIKQYLIDTL
jgi:tetratricopeptide (TPR) repeat protein